MLKKNICEKLQSFLTSHAGLFLPDLLKKRNTSHHKTRWAGLNPFQATYSHIKSLSVQHLLPHFWLQNIAIQCTSSSTEPFPIQLLWEAQIHPHLQRYPPKPDKLTWVSRMYQDVSRMYQVQVRPAKPRPWCSSAAIGRPLWMG